MGGYHRRSTIPGNDMKAALLAPLALLFALQAQAAGADAKPLATIGSLDVQRYM